MPFVIIIILQLIIAGIVVFILKNFLNRELEKAAVEKVMSLRANEDVKAINIYYAQSLPINVAEEFKVLIQNKFVNSKIEFEQLQDLKGGLIIKVGEEILDFSLSSRLENFWS